jgi:hypothetical protein
MDIAPEILEAELSYLQTDKELYLECLNGRPLKDRTTPEEIRDGLILFHHVYRHIKGSL